MTVASIAFALLAAICGLTLVLAVYELANGRLPGESEKRGLWGYRALSPTIRNRLAVVAGAVVVVAFLILYRSFTVGDIVGGLIGLGAGGFLTLSDSRSQR